MFLNHVTVYPISNEVEPTYVTQALKQKEWCDGMSKEFNALLQNHTWDLVPKTTQNLLGFIDKFVQQLHDRFMLKDLEELHQFLGVELDIDEMNYSPWTYFFEHLCKGHEILDHIIVKPTDMAETTPQIAKEAWDLLAKNFQDNKCTRSIALKAELRSLKLGDLSIDAYFQKIESIDTILKGLGSPLSNEDVVNISLEGLPTNPNVHTPPLALHTAHTSPNPGYALTRSPPGFYGPQSAHQLYYPALATSTLYNPTKPSISPSLDQHAPPVYNPTHFYYQAIQTGQPIQSGPTGQLGQTGHPGQTGQSGQQTGQPIHVTQMGPLAILGHSGPLTGQEILLPHAFHAATLQDPAADNWNMDTCASSHVNDSVSSLSEVFNLCIYLSVSVGDGHSIPVINSGHSLLPTPHRPLHLNNVLITPNIVKNLIYVHQFVRDNYCAIEFNAFGFSVKDFLTRRVLLCYDRTGDLYPVTKPSNIIHAFLTSK
ncbi:hypothetical protein Tco_1499723 [Tanacetum coccineum]